MENKLKSVALHITNECSAKCPMCYHGEQGPVVEGKLEVLKQIGDELRKYGVEEINLVGGDPAEYSHIEELLMYYHSLGFRIPILSNTHRYKNTTIERITPYVTSLEGTFHDITPEAHDAFNKSPGSYNMMLQNMLEYQRIKNEAQMTGAVLNVQEHNYMKFYAIIETLLEKGLSLDYVLIQRIGSYGRAEGNSNDYLKRILAETFSQIAKINEKLGIETSMVDAYPLCLIPKEYHQYVDCCHWGIDTASMDMDGNMTRCAVACHSGQNYLGNILVTPTGEIWEKHPTLVSFRDKDYLGEECQKCDMLSKCGGGCPVSCGNNILSPDILKRSR